MRRLQFPYFERERAKRGKPFACRCIWSTTFFTSLKSRAFRALMHQRNFARGQRFLSRPVESLPARNICVKCGYRRPRPFIHIAIPISVPDLLPKARAQTLLRIRKNMRLLYDANALDLGIFPDGDWLRWGSSNWPKERHQVTVDLTFEARVAVKPEN